MWQMTQNLKLSQKIYLRLKKSFTLPFYISKSEQKLQINQIKSVA